MSYTRFVIIAIVGFVAGCNFYPVQLAQLFSEETDSGQGSVADIAPGSISDPNAPAQSSPAATQAPI
ncbi:MAG: hypothetical protein ACYSWU_27830, partial [Planctomycetota bacterium]